LRSEVNEVRNDDWRRRAGAERREGERPRYGEGVANPGGEEDWRGRDWNMGDWGEQPAHAHRRHSPSEFENDRPLPREAIPDDRYVGGPYNYQSPVQYRGGFGYPETREGWLEATGYGRGSRHREPVQYDDSQIAQMVCDALDEDRRIPESAQIDVDVDDGVVTLGGQVRSRSVKRAAGECAWECPGVDDVDNVVRVMSRHRERRARAQPEVRTGEEVPQQPPTDASESQERRKGPGRKASMQ
jgi:hypothetical protein